MVFCCESFRVQDILGVLRAVHREEGSQPIVRRGLRKGQNSRTHQEHCSHTALVCKVLVGCVPSCALVSADHSREILPEGLAWFDCKVDPWLLAYAQPEGQGSWSPDWFTNLMCWRVVVFSI